MAKRKTKKTEAVKARKPPARQSVIKEIRRRAGRSLESLVPAMGLSVSQIYRIEADPWGAQVYQIERLAGALGVQIADLLADAQSLNPLEMPRTHPALPIMEISELGSRGVPSGKPREFIAPWSAVSPSAFGLQIKGHANAPELLDGETVIVDPEAALAVGDKAVAEVIETGEVLIGKWLPLTPADHKTPEFMIEPYNARATRCTRENPGRIIGRIMEKRTLYR